MFEIVRRAGGQFQDSDGAGYFDSMNPGLFGALIGWVGLIPVLWNKPAGQCHLIDMSPGVTVSKHLNKRHSPEYLRLRLSVHGGDFSMDGAV